MVAGAAAVVWAAMARDTWIVIIAAFAAYRSWMGFQQARIMARILNAPRHEDAACPACRAAPLLGDFWVCDKCHTQFDTFAHRAICPGCGNLFAQTLCPACGQCHPIESWLAPSAEGAGFKHDEPA
jgi:hypothetical protein